MGSRQKRVCKGARQRDRVRKKWLRCVSLITEIFLTVTNRTNFRCITFFFLLGERKILFRGLSKSTKKANFLLTTLTSWSESIIRRERRIDSVWNILNRSIGNFDKCPFWRKLKLFIEVEDKLIFLLPSGKRKRLSVAKVKVELDDAQLGHSTSYASRIRTS